MAAKKMHIEPSTISRQLRELERELGLTLLQGRPLRVTPAGERVFAFIKPMYEGLPRLIQQLRGGGANAVRIGAPPVVMQDYLPSMLAALEPKFPDLRLELHAGLQWQIVNWFEEDRLDLAVTMLEGEPPERPRLS